MKASDMRSCAHFSEGRFPLAFVFSVPGTEELVARKPVAGKTGRNLESALDHLHAACRGLFKSPHRYDYRITNAWPEPIAVALGDSGSQARDSQIRDVRNVQRVLDELEGCTLVVLSGKKAGLLANDVMESGRTVVEVPHVGDRGLSVSFRPAPWPALPADRQARRIEMWANAVLDEIPDDAMLP
jgi:hypothetical protein